MINGRRAWLDCNERVFSRLPHVPQVYTTCMEKTPRRGTYGSLRGVFLHFGRCEDVHCRSFGQGKQKFSYSKIMKLFILEKVYFCVSGMLSMRSKLIPEHRKECGA